MGGSPAGGNLFCFQTSSPTTGGAILPVTQFFFINSSGGLYASNTEGTDTWQSVAPGGTALKAGGAMFQFGVNAIYCCQSRAPIKKDLSVNYATAWSNLGGSPPTARCGDRIRDHVVLANLGTDVFSVQWSAIGDAETWPTPGTADALSKEAGTQALSQEFGRIQYVLGGEKFGLIFQDRAITRMTYVGGSAVFEFDVFERRVGMSEFAGGVPTYHAGLWYWPNENGVFATDGYSVKKVSTGQIDEALFQNTISHPLASSLSYGTYGGVVDYKRRQIIWGPALYTGGTVYLLKFSVDSGQFSLLSGSTFMALANGTSGSGYTGNDNYRRNVYNLNGSNAKLQRLDGTTGTIAMQTGYIEISTGQRIQLQGAHLLGAGVPGSLTLAYKSTSSLGSVDVSQSGFTSLTAPSAGMKSVGRASDQFFSFRITGTGTESQLIRGLRIYYSIAEPAR